MIAMVQFLILLGVALSALLLAGSAVARRRPRGAVSRGRTFSPARPER